MGSELRCAIKPIPPFSLKFLVSSRGVHFSTHTPLLKVLRSLRWSDYFVKKVLLLTGSFCLLLMISVGFSSEWLLLCDCHGNCVGICLTGQCKPHLCHSLCFTQPLSPESCLRESMADTKLGIVALSSQILEIPGQRFTSSLGSQRCCTDALCF